MSSIYTSTAQLWSHALTNFHEISKEILCTKAELQMCFKKITNEQIICLPFCSDEYKKLNSMCTDPEAFVIAYTSDYIPRMVYTFGYSQNNTLEGYIDSSLSLFNTSDFGVDMGVDKDNQYEDEPNTCQYRGYRNGPDHADKYGLSPQYWHIFAARLAFVVIFEHIVFALTGIMAYAIPDVPREVKTQIQREKLLAKEEKYERGTTRIDEYDELLNAIRNTRNSSQLSNVIRRKSWVQAHQQRSSLKDQDSQSVIFE